MTDQQPKKSIPDPAAQDTDREDTSVVPSLDHDPVEEEKKRTEGFGPNRPDLA